MSTETDIYSLSDGVPMETPEISYDLLAKSELGDHLQVVQLSKDEYNALKQRLAQLRGIAPKTDKQQAAVAGKGVGANA